MLPKNPVPDITDIAKEVQSTAVKSGKWMSTHARIMKLIDVNKKPNQRLGPGEFRLIELERQAAQLPIKTVEHQTRLNRTLAILNNNITELGNSKNLIAAQMYKNYSPQFNEDKKDALNILEQREAFEKSIDPFIQEKDQRIAEIKEAFKQKKPTNIIKAMLDQLEKRVHELEKKFEELNTNENVIQRKLDTLQRETTNTLITTGAPVRPVPAAEQPAQPPSTKGLT